MKDQPLHYCDICEKSEIYYTKKDPHAKLLRIEQLFDLWICTECADKKIAWLATKEQQRWIIIPIYDDSLTYLSCFPYSRLLQKHHIIELPYNTKARVPMTWHFKTKEDFFQTLAESQITMTDGER